jgi:hypothetical protein
MTLGVALMIAMWWKYETNDCVLMTLAVLIPTALVLVCLYLYLQDDPVQQFLLESGKEIVDNEEWGGTRNHMEESWVGQTVHEPASQQRITPTTSSYLCGVPQTQDMEDRGAADD